MRRVGPQQLGAASTHSPKVKTDMTQSCLESMYLCIAMTRCCFSRARPRRPLLLRPHSAAATSSRRKGLPRQPGLALCLWGWLVVAAAGRWGSAQSAPRSEREDRMATHGIERRQWQPGGTKKAASHRGRQRARRDQARTRAADRLHIVQRSIAADDGKQVMLSGTTSASSSDQRVTLGRASCAGERGITLPTLPRKENAERAPVSK